MKRAEQAILLNGQPAFGRTVLREGDVLRILVPEETGDGAEPSIIPVPLPLDILYEDEDILVLNKPADMPVHPSAGNYENTLANGVAWYYKQQGKAFVYRCINRLDRDTTGVLVLAKNPLSGALLSAQMKQRQIRRTYLALTDGIPPEKGTISAPVARMDASVITREVNFERGEAAVTHYERLAVNNGYALVELHLDTGRTSSDCGAYEVVSAASCCRGFSVFIRLLEPKSDARPCIPSSWNLLTPSPGSLCVSLHLCLRISAEHLRSKKSAVR